MTLFILVLNKYIVPSNEDFEPGSEDVLKNYLGITSEEEIEKLESQRLMLVQEQIEDTIGQDQKLLASDICSMHLMWLEDIYPIAGHYRTVTMGKDGHTFASPVQIPRLSFNCCSNYSSMYYPASSNFEYIGRIGYQRCF